LSDEIILEFEKQDNHGYVDYCLEYLFNIDLDFHTQRELEIDAFDFLKQIDEWLNLKFGERIQIIIKKVKAVE